MSQKNFLSDNIENFNKSNPKSSAKEPLFRRMKLLWSESQTKLVNKFKKRNSSSKKGQLEELERYQCENSLLESIQQNSNEGVATKEKALDKEIERVDSLKEKLVSEYSSLVFDLKTLLEKKYQKKAELAVAEAYLLKRSQNPKVISMQ